MTSMVPVHIIFGPAALHDACVVLDGHLVAKEVVLVLMNECCFSLWFPLVFHLQGKLGLIYSNVNVLVWRLALLLVKAIIDHVRVILHRELV
jgi:hypothetical protein